MMRIRAAVHCLQQGVCLMGVFFWLAAGCLRRPMIYKITITEIEAE
jgi:hypothetical protein